MNTIRWRIILGLSGLFVGLVIASVVGVASLATLRRALATEIESLRTSTEVGNGLVTSVFEEIRTAEQYLAAPSAEARDQFQVAADEAFRFQKELDGLEGLTESDRITVSKIKQLQALIHVDYSIAHALVDLGRMREAFAQLLEPACDVVGTVADGRALLEIAPRLQPDVVVLDGQ